MPALWIIDRDASRRLALARLAGAGAEALLASPAQRDFEDLGAARLVMLALAGDFELELEFAHRMAPRLHDASWLLLAEGGDLDEARRLFDTLAAELLPFPPESAALRRRVGSALGRRRVDPLSERRVRDALAARFARWFADLELPDFLRALDPHHATTPLLVRGEPGTGRRLLAQYAHAFGGTTGGAFVSVDCAGVASAEQLAAALARGARSDRARSALSVALEQVDRLPLTLQRELRDWVELAPPEAVRHSARLRWIATASDAAPWTECPALDPGLAQALAGLELRIPPLRERRAAIPALVAAAACAWADDHGQAPRRFDEHALEALQSHPWPGNLRELEAVVFRTLACDTADPIEAGGLRFHGDLPRAAPEHALAGAETPGPAPTHEEHERPGVAPAQPATGEARSAAIRAAASVDPTLQRLFESIAHEVRNPLVGILTLSQLLPQRFEDPEFRGHFARVVGTDVRRIERVLDRLSEFAALGPPVPTRIDVAALLDELLEARRQDIQERRLLVLKELDRTQPYALADEGQLRFALESLLGKALELVPERGDLYLASKHHPTGLRRKPSVRILARFHSPQRIAPGAGRPGASVAENTLEFVFAQQVLCALGGEVTLDATDADETLILLDLPAPA